MIEKIFSKTHYYLIVIGILAVHFFQENRVLNFPTYINITLFITAFVLVFIIAYKYDNRYNKNIIDYEKVIKGNEDINVFSAPLFNLLGIALIAFTISCAIRVPIVSYIEYSAKINPLKVKRLSINNIKLRNNSTIYVEFRGDIEKLEKLRRNKKKIAKDKLLKHYLVQLEYRESILGTSVVDNFKVIKK